MSTLIFDIETVCDIPSARRYYNFTDDLEDQDVCHALRNLNLQQTGREFLQHPFHKIICISVVYQQVDQIKIASLGDEHSSEAKLIQKFFDIIEKKSPQLVSWNGSGFDFPVLHYRAMLHSISAPQYFEIGEKNSSFKFNNYLNRYHERHIDLMDVLSGYQPRASVSLNILACLLGFPGKMGMDGSQVQSYFTQGRLSEIRAYCETDVLNTYLLFLRFEYMRGKMTQEQYQFQQENLKLLLNNPEQPHWQEFLKAWEEGESMNRSS